MRNDRILFLDFDGVLNNNLFFAANAGGPTSYFSGYARDPLDDIDPASIPRLRRIVDRTRSKIVISSAWRNFHSQLELVNVLKAAGWGKGDVPIIGMTPYIAGPLVLGSSNTIRGREIEQWRRENEHTGPFAIVDDNNWMLPEHRPIFVKTEMRDGLQDHHVERLIEILGRRRPLLSLPILERKTA